MFCVAFTCAGAQVTAIAHVQVTSGPRDPARAAPAAVFWLQPLSPGESSPPRASGPFTLQQKNRTFVPHLLVVPLGSTVSFPNEDPFFHNVFSLYNGKRFDLGLYETGTTRQVVFAREGVSYIFCNIHPEMSAVVLALSTPWWAKSDSTGALRITGVPAGDYDAHLWVEGVSPDQLSHWTHHVTLRDRTQIVGDLTVPPGTAGHRHLNKFGQPYSGDVGIY